MKLEQWKKIQEELQDDYNRFSEHYGSYKNGKNKKIRADAEREMRAAMHSAKRLIVSDDELSDLLTPDKTNFGRAIAFDEFNDPTYFRQDLPDILGKIESKIEELKESKK